MLTASVVEPLKIEVAPDIVEILGLNLYTDLSRVLVEFVANAYDADSPWVDLKIDIDKIALVRRDLRERLGRFRNNSEEEVVLPSDLRIIVEDRGHGMSREELQKKFLRIGRKRRKSKEGDRSPNGRPVMGRKGIGKLAGFGVARRVEIITKPKDQNCAIQIALDYRKLIGHETTEEIEVEEKTLDDGAGLLPSGTRVILSELAFEPTGVQLDTISRQIAKHFSIVKAEEFVVQINGKQIPPFSRDYAFSYPNQEISWRDLVDYSIEVDGHAFPFQYRIRFTSRGKQLPASERGVRVYARQRLASAPSLLDLGTGMHGFQNTHYLDGEVHADFIDDQRSDYIASDRQDLRWDTPILAELKKFLTHEMERACVAYQNTKEETLAERVKNDPFTRQAIDSADLPTHRRAVAFRIAAKLAAGSPEETADEYYRETLPIVVRGLGYGELMSSIREIARAEHPSFTGIIKALADLTAAEWDDYSKIVSGRLRGIEALRKICASVDFRAPSNEGELHDLLKGNPWLIDPTFWAFLTSNVSEKTLSEQLSKALGVDQYVPEGYDRSTSDESDPLQSNKRPDLTFLLSNYALQRVVVVELKAPNTPLHIDHLVQLEGYMRRAEDYFRAKVSDRHIKIEGYLIGSRATERHGGQEKVKALRYREEKRGVDSDWQVFDINELLRRAEDSHRELVDAYARAEQKEVI